MISRPSRASGGEAARWPTTENSRRSWLPTSFGFSRLAGADEDRTLARLRALRSDLIDPTIAVHNGRVVKRMGDGAIVEFRSVVDAVRCAIEVQNAMVERNAGVPPERADRQSGFPEATGADVASDAECRGSRGMSESRRSQLPAVMLIVR